MTSNLNIIASKRFTICEECDKYSSYFCKECNCFMPAKVLIPGAKCPLNKWEK